MNIKSVLFIAIVILLFSCNRQIKPEGITVTGQFLNAAGKKIYFSELDVNGINKLDSTVLDEKGKFHFNYKPTDAGFYLLKSASGENFLLLMDKVESASVEADFKKAPFDYHVAGSSGSTLLKDFYSQTFVHLSKADSLASVLRTLKETPEFYPKSVEFEPFFRKIIEDQRNLEISFIQNNSSSLASLIVLNYKFGLLPVLTLEQDFEIFLNLNISLSKVYPSNKHVVTFHERVSEYQHQLAAQKIREIENKKK